MTYQKTNNEPTHNEESETDRTSISTVATLNKKLLLLNLSLNFEPL